MGILNIITVVVLAIAIYSAYLFSTKDELNWTIMETYLSHPMCHKIGEDLIYGPEDITFAGDNILFVSSHNRRDMKSVGTIFTVDVARERIKECAFDVVPPHFRPHGIAVAQCEDHSRLFVISHTFGDVHWHSIEVFDYFSGKSTITLQYVKTLTSPLLISPNDLIALNCDELIVSNDHGTNFIPQMLMDDIFQLRKSTMVHFDGQHWTELEAPPHAAFGNGLILRRQESGGADLLIRSSAADYSLFTFAIRREEKNEAGSTAGSLKLELLYEEKLPFSPDNIEYDVASGGIIITGHPSTTRFVFHAGLQARSPSVVVLYDGKGNYTTLYYAPRGLEISGSSTATRSIDKKLFIGQVFDPFVLVCEPYDDNEAGYLEADE